MKRVYFVILSVFSVLTINAQDVIYKTNGDSIVTKVLGTNYGNIKYANWENEKVYINSIPLAQVRSISYKSAPLDSLNIPKFIIQTKESPISYASSPFLLDTVLTRKGNHYFYKDTKMTPHEYSNFLAANCPNAYQCFQNGYRMSNIGWALLSAGVAIDISAVIVRYSNRYIIDSDGTSFRLSPSPGTVHGIVFLGVAMVAASIPTLSIGYARMHESMDIYNVEKSTPKYPPSLSVTNTANGIGVALNF